MIKRLVAGCLGHTEPVALHHRLIPSGGAWFGALTSVLSPPWSCLETLLQYRLPQTFIPAPFMSRSF